MPQDPWSSALFEAGDVIGNIGRRLTKKGRRRQQTEESVQRWLSAIPLPDLSPIGPYDAEREACTIDGTYRVLEDEDGEGR